jgi:hypothetical protein
MTVAENHPVGQAQRTSDRYRKPRDVHRTRRLYANPSVKRPPLVKLIIPNDFLPVLSACPARFFILLVVRRLDPIFATLAPGAGSAPKTPGREGRDGTAERGYLQCGPHGAGHFVKMVHNGIEYGDMQLICEAYLIMKDLLGMSAGEMHAVFKGWNERDLDSYLIKITGDILAFRDGDGEPLVDKIGRAWYLWTSEFP